MRIKFAIAGGRGVGFGHVMRCASIATEAAARGHSVSFALRGDATAALALGEEVADVVVLPWAGTDQLRDCDWLVIDAPGPIRAELEAAAAAGVRTCVLGRLDQLEHADATVLPFAHGPGISHPRLVQGPEWCFVAAAMSTYADRPYPDTRHIALITLGAADPLGLTVPIARVVRDGLLASADSGWLELHAVVGPAFADDEVVARELEALGCRLRRGPGRAELASLMGRATFALAGFGSSLYDLAAVGVPTVYWTHQAEDLEAARRLEAAGLGALGGDGLQFSVAECRDLLGRTVLDPMWRVHASVRGRAVVARADGAARLVTLMERGLPLEATA
jgi:spore coat polysaccharide biosynthesis predicted glycosyltransferase SpsG